MKAFFNLDQITSSSLIATLLNETFPSEEFEIIKRPASFLIRTRKEQADKVNRIIMLPPHGFTANAPDEVAPHPEVRKAKVVIKGGVRPCNKGFIVLKNALKYRYYEGREVDTQAESPYPKIKGKGYKEALKSSKEKFFVVQENGTGFYHSLVNLSNEWVCVVLEKELKLERKIDLSSVTSPLAANERNLVERLFSRVSLLGDRLFVEDPGLVEQIVKMNSRKSVPYLIEMLNIMETGKHGPCTIYAIILKVGRRDMRAIESLKTAIKDNSAPKYYLQELLAKLSS